MIVLDPGIETRVVDLGRPRSRSLGVSVGGAADRRSLLLGNALLGNEPTAPALEFALKGPTLQTDVNVGCVIFGAPFEAHLNGYPVEIGRTFTMHCGDELRIGGVRQGARAYLCVRGGFQLPLILASHSALDPVKRNDKLICESSHVRGRFCPELHFNAVESPTFAVLPGLQADWFDEDDFYQQTYKVTPASNRMGLRLSGKPSTFPERELTSEPVCPGSIQVTRDGQCIVLGVDGQTIGGYPKIAQVIDADLDTLGQLRPGQGVRFVKIVMDDAIRRDREAKVWLREWILRLRASFNA